MNNNININKNKKKKWNELSICINKNYINNKQTNYRKLKNP